MIFDLQALYYALTIFFSGLGVISLVAAFVYTGLWAENLFKKTIWLPILWIVPWPCAIIAVYCGVVAGKIH